ncbi:MAG: ParA family protein [Gammaproteobacteria bacterium]|nr:MAG: ParA family protein [Gammaproteobacteria bacterium]
MENCYLQVSEICNVLGGVTPQSVYKTLKNKNLESIMLTARKKVLPPQTVQSILVDKSFNYRKKIISFHMIKGGVGKTTLSSTIGVRASHYGCRTLLIDFDLQGNLTRSFDLPDNSDNIWINVLKGECNIEDAIVKIDDYLDILPSNLNNSMLDIFMSQNNTNLKDIVSDHLNPIIDNYDLIIIDCPPAINKVSASAICASDEVIIPLNPDQYAMDGLDMTIHEINNLKKSFKLKKLNYQIVWNKYDARKRLGAIYMHDLAKEVEGSKILPVVIRVDSAYENAIANATSIFELSRSSSAKEDIDQATREILGISQWTEKHQRND